MNIGPKSILFSIVLSSARHSFANESQCANHVLDNTNLDCPIGACRVGFKNYASLFPSVNVDQLSGEQCHDTQEWCAYCDCNEDEVQPGRSGKTGAECETKFTLCPDGEQVCFHGAPCVKVDETDNFICGCAYIPDRDKTYLGEHCEYEATDICETTMSFGSYQPYCTNNGRCRRGIVGEEKCSCKEGFHGLHCEFKEKPECDLECQNGGLCNTGVDTFYREQKSKSYCVCHEGYSGDTCQYIDAEDCAESVCMNGSTCRSEFEKDGTNFFCDCSDVKKVNEAGNPIPHAGNGCETPATTMCKGQDGYADESYFCTNGGTCPTDPYLPCTCPQPFSGPRCEFKGEEVKECSYGCENGGTCFFGDTPDYYGVDRNRLSETEMHCKCPLEYTGLHCEDEVIVLCDDKHHCGNGGKCVEDGDSFKCDCTGTLHAGSNCETHATTLCAGFGYCVNGGSCITGYDPVSSLQSHDGCDCTPPFFGDYCEYEDEGSAAGKVVMGLTISLLGLLIIFLSMYYIRLRSIEGEKYDHHALNEGPNVYLDSEDPHKQVHDNEHFIT